MATLYIHSKMFQGFQHLLIMNYSYFYHYVSLLLLLLCIIHWLTIYAVYPAWKRYVFFTVSSYPLNTENVCLVGIWNKTSMYNKYKCCIIRMILT